MNDVLAIAKERKGKILPICYLCGEVPESGIRGGLKLKKAFICKKCEQEIVSLRIDSPLYEEVKEKIKKILR